MIQKEDYKFGIRYEALLEEVTKDRQEAHAWKATVRKGYPKHYIVRSYPHTCNGLFLWEGDNFPFYGFPEPRYIKNKGILVATLEVFND